MASDFIRKENAMVWNLAANIAVIDADAISVHGPLSELVWFLVSTTGGIEFCHRASVDRHLITRNSVSKQPETGNFDYSLAV